MIGVMLLVCPPAFSLKSMTVAQMKNVSGQGGVDIAISGTKTEFTFNDLKFSNPDDPDNQYVNFSRFHILSSLDTGSTDNNSDGNINHLMIDIGSINNKVMLVMNAPDLTFNTDLTISDIVFNGTSIGSLEAQDILLSSMNFSIGPHTGSGIDFEFGLQSSVSSISYKYNTTESLTFTNIAIAGSFIGTDPDDTVTWIQPDTVNNQFKLGAVTADSPATIDVTADSRVIMNIPTTGSIRVGNVNFGGTDFGAIAIDGINAQKLTIELPGRGLGQP
jgi:hypothetical protein